MSPGFFTLCLLVASLVMVFLLVRTIRRTKVDRDPFEREEKFRREYLALAGRDGVDPEVAKSFLTEIEIDRRTAERNRREKEERKTGDAGSAGFDGDF